MAKHVLEARLVGDDEQIKVSEAKSILELGEVEYVLKYNGQPITRKREKEIDFVENLRK
jgi:hypothetical protein